jgi:chemotaxis protein MotB
MQRRYVRLVIVCCAATLLFGCAQNQELVKSNARQRAIIQDLTNEVERLQQEIDRMKQMGSSLEKTKLELEEKLRQQMANGDLAVSMNERGIVVSILDRILFDPGKADVKSSAFDTLSLVASSLNNLAVGQLVCVEGHTDSDPIVRSGYKSNWELSTTRATEVLHYLVDNCGVDPRNIVASGFGEFQPVSDNDSVAGKAKNRRVEIVISRAPRVYQQS